MTIKYKQKKIFLGFIILYLAMEISILLVPYLEFIGFFSNNSFSQKPYELAQKISSSDLEKLEELTKVDSKIQNKHVSTESNYRNEQEKDESSFKVVIVHRGSQVLLMNGKIDGNDTINPLEDMSSSNLVIDISSYEFQEASQYRAPVGRY